MFTQVCPSEHWWAPVSHSFMSRLKENKECLSFFLSELGSRVFSERALTLAEACAQELIAIRTDTGEFAVLINTLILAQVTGVAALVYVCRQTMNMISCSSWKLHKYFSQICVFILAFHIGLCLLPAYHCRQSHLAPAHNPAHIDTGTSRMCYNTSDCRGPPCHTHQHLSATEWQSRRDHIWKHWAQGKQWRIAVTKKRQSDNPFLLPLIPNNFKWLTI